MADFFNEILNMSINASWLILAVMLIRLIFAKAPKWIRGITWAMVGLRLVLPFSFETALSLIPSAEAIPQETVRSHSAENIGTAEVLSYIGNNPVSYSIAIQDGSIIFNEYCAPDVETVNPLLIIMTVASVLWLIGLATLLIYTAISTFRLKSKISSAVLLRDNVYQSEAVGSPFIFGIIKPKIYIPFGLSEDTLQYVEAHENAHLRRFDHITKIIGFLILCLHWFNPLVWLAYSLFCKDIELACDEKVLRETEAEKRREYATAILDCGISRRRIAACPLAFGETSIKERVKNALSYKKPMIWVIIVAVIACIAVAIGFMTNPDDKSKNPSTPFTATEGSSSHLGVKMTVTDLNLEGDDPTVTVEWSNGIENTVFFGEQFDILYCENGRWESCLKPDTENITHLLLYMLKPGGKKEMVYHINNFDLSRQGDYRVSATYELDIYMDQSLSRQLGVYAGFSLSEAVTVNPNVTNPFPLEPESATVNNEFIGIQSGSIPYSDALMEKYPIPDGYDDVPIFAGASNRDKLYYSSIQHLPTYGIRSVEDLEEYKRMTLRGTAYERKSVLDGYDEEFFEDNILIMINSLEQNDRFTYRMMGVYSSGSDVWVLIEKTHPKEYKDGDTAYGINVAIEVRRKDIPNAETFDAWIERNILPEESVTFENKYKTFIGTVTSVRDDVITVKSDEGETVHIDGTWLGNTAVAIRVDNPSSWRIGDKAEIIYTALYKGADSIVKGVVSVTKK